MKKLIFIIFLLTIPLVFAYDGFDCDDNYCSLDECDKGLIIVTNHDGTVLEVPFIRAVVPVTSFNALNHGKVKMMLICFKPEISVRSGILEVTDDEFIFFGPSKVEIIPNNFIIEEKSGVSVSSSVSLALSEGCSLNSQSEKIASVECPDGVIPQNSRPNRLFYITDLGSAKHIKTDQVWDLGYDGTGIKVAVLDTGVDVDHVELSDSIVAVRNFIDDNEDVTDGHGHGTHVAGIIASNGDNEQNSTGIAPGVDLFIGRVCNDQGSCTDEDLTEGINWAVDQKVDVISLSVAGGNEMNHCDEDDLAKVINSAVDQGIVVVVSSGNDNMGVSKPACASGAIAVGATYYKESPDETWDWLDEGQSRSCDNTDIDPDVRVCWSNYGPALDLVAPGVDIYSTFISDTLIGQEVNGHYYGFMDGTSQAAPHVAGAVALILEAHPEFDKNVAVDKVKSSLYDSAVDLGDPQFDNRYGNGRIDVLEAVKYYPIDQEPEPDGENLIKNPSFSDTLAGRLEVKYGSDWERGTGSWSDRLTTITAENYLYMYSNATEKNWLRYEQLLDLNEGDYKMTIDAKTLLVNGRGVSASVSCAQIDGCGSLGVNAPVENSPIGLDNDDWETKFSEFSIQTKGLYYLRLFTEDGSQAYFDDIRLIVAGTTNELLTNGKFDQKSTRTLNIKYGEHWDRGEDNWVDYLSSVYSAGYLWMMSRVESPRNASKYTQDVDLQATTYEFSANVEVLLLNGNGVSISVVDSNGEIVEDSEIVFDGSDWEIKSTEFTVSTAGTYTVQLVVEDGSQAHFDDIVLKEVAS